MAEFDAPLSRTEALLQNALGAENKVYPQSRVEELLALLNEKLAEQDSGEDPQDDSGSSYTPYVVVFSGPDVDTGTYVASYAFSDIIDEYINHPTVFGTYYDTENLRDFVFRLTSANSEQTDEDLYAVTSLDFTNYSIETVNSTTTAVFRKFTVASDDTVTYSTHSVALT